MLLICYHKRKPLIYNLFLDKCMCTNYYIKLSCFKLSIHFFLFS